MPTTTERPINVDHIDHLLVVAYLIRIFGRQNGLGIAAGNEFIPGRFPTNDRQWADAVNDLAMNEVAASTADAVVGYNALRSSPMGLLGTVALGGIFGGIRDRILPRTLRDHVCAVFRGHRFLGKATRADILRCAPCNQPLPAPTLVLRR